MAEISWSEPVVVFAGKAGSVRWTVGDAAKAATILMSHWPKRAPKGPAYVKAMEMMLACLKGKCDPEVARGAFIAAAKEADILAE
ncbi:DUF982 domain-containing protein [Nitratireductor sp. GCM10026969]|uniref:DUF982 domain-containing protein n=1 Tax=Nitratireductor sp. GCM10026969 TaxID=3252645 RepID=UPI00361D8589